MSTKVDNPSKATKLESLPRIDPSITKPRNTKPLNDSPAKTSPSPTFPKSDSQSSLGNSGSNLTSPRTKGSQANLFSKGSQANLLSKGSQSNLLKSSGSKFNLSENQSNMTKIKGSQGNILNANAFHVEDDSREELNTDELLSKLEQADDVLFDSNRQFFNAQKAMYGKEAVMSKYSVLQGIKREREEAKKEEDGNEQENDGEFLLFPSELKRKLPTIKKREVITS
ncbi:hypothetical protein HK103_001924 [Boothiomyces macroporosus]|uniref:Uncharacterized protein n=1 Tax=Boothiomyces macroporosus TaxID=261099 RepID=A0AAD5UJI6_9FUNG|nr:hypothetical protein HK103_001924 [Boothiomyces macroporosus]